MSSTQRKIAIVGSGPAGCYLAQALRRQLHDVELAIFERLPVPYGLLRYGVAADHQGTKAISRQFDRLFEREGVLFFGNVVVGRDISLQELRSAFDVVVLSTGLHEDLPLGVPGDALKGMIGSGRFTRFLNGHPEESAGEFKVGARTVVIGAGNVAMDIVRLLAATEEGLRGSDIDDAVLRGVRAGLERIEVVSRSAASQAKFDLSMLRELGKLPEVAFELHESPTAPTGGEDEFVKEDEDEEAGLAKKHLLREFADRNVPEPRLTVSFRFGLQPDEVIGDSGVSGIRLRVTDGTNRPWGELEADSVITAIGYRQGEDDPLRRDALITPRARLEDGLLDDGLYCAGWVRTGPRGTIPTHRTEAKRIAERIAADLEMKETLNLPGVKSSLLVHMSNIVDWEGWKLIDQFERSSADPDRVRAKVRDVETMMVAARNGLSIH